MNTAANAKEIARLLATLEPSSLDELIGQPELVAAIRELKVAAKQRQHPVPAMMLVGPEAVGLGAVAATAAAEITEGHGEAIHRVDAQQVMTIEALADVVSDMEVDEVLIVEHIHRLPRKVYQALSTVASDYRLPGDIKVGDSNTSRVDIELPFFSVIATSNVAMEPEVASLDDLMSQDWISLRVVPYEISDLVEMAVVGARRLGVEITDEAARTLAKQSRGRPRLLQQMLALVYLEYSDRLQRDGSEGIVESMVVEILDSSG